MLIEHGRALSGAAPEASCSRDHRVAAETAARAAADVVQAELKIARQLIESRGMNSRPPTSATANSLQSMPRLYKRVHYCG